MINDSTTIGEAKQLLRQGFVDGILCPCCDQLCKATKRRMRKPWAMLLNRIFIEHGQEWVHVVNAYSRDIGRLANDWRFLRHHGLLEMHPNDDASKTHSGYWRVTDLGRDFINDNATRIPAFVVVLFNQVIAESEETVSFLEVMSQPSRFDLADVRDLSGMSEDLIMALSLDLPNGRNATEFRP